MPVNASMALKVRATLTGAADYGSPVSNIDFTQIFAATDGTGAGQADIVWADERTVASGANDDIDLAPLVNALGVSQTPLELVGLIVVNAPKSGLANTTNLTIGGGTNPVTPGFMGGTTPTIGPIRPGGIVALWNSDSAAGFGVITPATADILRIANSAGASATYQIFILARSA